MVVPSASCAKSLQLSLTNTSEVESGYRIWWTWWCTESGFAHVSVVQESIQKNIWLLSAPC